MYNSDIKNNKNNHNKNNNENNNQEADRFPDFFHFQILIFFYDAFELFVSKTFSLIFKDFLRFFKILYVFFVIVEAISWDIEVMKTSIFLLFDPLHFELIRGYN